MYQPKNILQEALQKNRKGVPVYTYSPSSWGFKCTLHVTVNRDGPLIFTAEDRSKILASNAAAEEALKYLDIQSCPLSCTGNIYAIPEDPIGYILLDLESIQLSELNGIPGDILSRIHIIGFMSEYHHNFTNPVIAEACQVYTVKSTQKDVADHLLTFHASRLPGNTPVAIRTNDHFGSCLADILSVYRPAFHAGNHVHLLDYIKGTFMRKK